MSSEYAVRRAATNLGEACEIIRQLLSNLRPKDCVYEVNVKMLPSHVNNMQLNFFVDWLEEFEVNVTNIGLKYQFARFRSKNGGPYNFIMTDFSNANAPIVVMNGIDEYRDLVDKLRCEALNHFNMGGGVMRMISSHETTDGMYMIKSEMPSNLPDYGEVIKMGYMCLSVGLVNDLVMAYMDFVKTTI